MIKQFVPKEFRELLDYISPAAFRVVDWKDALGHLLSMSRRAFDVEGMNHIAAENLKFTNQDIQHVLDQAPFKHEEKELPTAIGCAALDLYFSQLFSTEATLIDLRPSCFAMDEQQIHFRTGRLVHEFASSFKEGMRNLYAGYYLDDSELLDQGMLAVGLTAPEDSDQSKEEIKALLFTHFGTADQGPITFSLKHFTDSFHALFTHLREQNKTLSSDFIFLGIYLVTLYMTISRVSEPLDVQQIFKDCWQRNCEQGDV